MDTKPKYPNRAIEIPVTHLDLIEFCLRGVSISVLNCFEKSDTEWIYQDYRSFTRQLQKFSFPDPVDPFGVALGVIPVRRNDSLPGKGFRAVPFDDGTIPFGSFSGIHPKWIRPVSPSCQQNPPSEALKNGLTGSGYATLGFIVLKQLALVR
jgi:hypothetical protein